MLADLGADVVFQIAGATGEGVLEAVCAAGLHGIGVDVDQALSLPPASAECVRTSAEKKLQQTVSAVVTSVADGTFQAGPVRYDAASTPPAIGLSPIRPESLATPELQALLDAATAGFIDGSLDPAAAPAS